MIRIAESLARMRLETVVTREDVLEAVRLMQVATLAAATDATTGLTPAARRLGTWREQACARQVCR